MSVEPDDATLHDPPISFFLICLITRIIFVTHTDHEALYYVIPSNPLLSRPS